ncbi:hypothetical protein LWI29_002229 [Acer saccharum]|uniref:Uncharacterized protein n=1 Tax=Acer saccharum TaxID=4024 RepID=A0AA39SQH9_ACESA|nr:hypothetical protein LWI29_002229 [Acer saccharum]
MKFLNVLPLKMKINSYFLCIKSDALGVVNQCSDICFSNSDVDNIVHDIRFFGGVLQNHSLMSSTQTWKGQLKLLEMPIRDIVVALFSQLKLLKTASGINLTKTS